MARASCDGLWRGGPALWALLLVPACGHVGSLERNGLFVKPEVHYFIGDVPPHWKKLNLSGNDLAFKADDSPHLMAVNSTCRDYEDAPLPVLTRHLLMGFTERKLISEETHMLDGREALFSHYLAKLDGQPVELMLVVLKKDRCIYDFTYLSPPGRYEEKEESFKALLSRFKSGARL